MPSGAVTALGYPDTSLASFSDADVLNRVIYRPALTSDFNFMKSNGYFSPLLVNKNGFGSRYNKGDCKLFKKNPRVNPRTGKRLKQNSTVYRKITNDCKRSVKPKITQNVCKRFIENQNNGIIINPRTGKKITIDGPIYKMLVDKCKRYSMIPTNNKVVIQPNNVPSFFIGNKPPPPSEEFDFYNENIFVQPRTNTPVVGVPEVIVRNKNKVNLEPGVNGEINGINYTVVPNQSISFGGKIFKLQQKALINNTEYGTITNIGKSMILLTRNPGEVVQGTKNKQRRMYHPAFVLLNS